MAKRKVKVKLPIWSPITKSLESPLISLLEGGMPYTIGKISTRVIILLQIGGLHTKLRGPKIAGILILGILGFPLESPERIPGQNDIWVLVLWPSTKYTIRGRWWLPPSLGHDESCESVFARGSFMHWKGSNYALTNLWFGLCRSMWIIELLVNLLSPHSGAPTCPSTFEMLWAKERTQLLFLSLFSPLDSKLSPSRSLGVRQWWLQYS